VIEIPTNDFYWALKVAEKIRSDDPTRPGVRQVLVERHEHGIQLVATDTYILAFFWLGNPKDCPDWNNPGTPLETARIPELAVAPTLHAINEGGPDTYHDWDGEEIVELPCDYRGSVFVEEVGGKTTVSAGSWSVTARVWNFPDLRGADARSLHAPVGSHAPLIIGGRVAAKLALLASDRNHLCIWPGETETSPVRWRTTDGRRWGTYAPCAQPKARP